MFQFVPDADVLRHLLESIVGRHERASVSDQLLVLEDFLGQLLPQDRVERHVEHLDVLLAADPALRDVPLQLRRQRHHLAAGTHRRDRLLDDPSTHRLRSVVARQTSLERLYCPTLKRRGSPVTEHYAADRADRVPVIYAARYAAEA